MRQITDQDIKDAFLILINQNGTTSTKEVKEYLRSEGFWVFQSQVSQVINDSFQSLNTERVSNGIYFEYSLVEVDDTDDDDDDDTDDDDDDDDDDDIDDDDDTVVVTVNTTVNSFSSRQLKFRKDSNVELESKLRNPKYAQYKLDIKSVLRKRGVAV